MGVSVLVADGLVGVARPLDIIGCIFAALKLTLLGERWTRAVHLLVRICKRGVEGLLYDTHSYHGNATQDGWENCG